MNARLLVVLILSFLFGEVQAQNTTPRISIDNRDYKPVCSYTETKIFATVTGQFNSDNKFFVEFVNTSTNAILASYEANYKNGMMAFTILDDKLDPDRTVSYRVSATSPAVTSNFIYSNTLHNRGQVTLTPEGEMEDTLNVGSRIGTRIGSTANSKVHVVVSDSTSYDLSPSSYAGSFLFTASKNYDLFIVRATNACNVAVPSSGRISVKINPISIIPTKINNPAVCEGGEIELAYSTSGGSIPASAKFRLRLKQTGNITPTGASVTEIPAVLRGDGILVAKIPENSRVPYYSGFQVAILVDNPALVSPYSASFNLYKKPIVEIKSQSGTIPIGGQFNIDFFAEGPRPLVIELNNGLKHIYSSAYNYRQTVSLYPTKTETYSIKSFQTLCGVTTDVPKQTVVATVQPGISIPLPGFQNRDLCENQKLRLPFASNVQLNSSTTFLVEGITTNKKVYQFEAKLINDSLEFLIPHSPLEWLNEGYFSIKSFRVKTSNPSYTSVEVYGFNIRGIPRISYETFSSNTLAYPQYVNFTIKVAGGYPFYMKGPNDEWIDNNADGQYVRVFISKSGPYQPKSVSNVCYSSDKVNSLNFTVQDYKGSNPVIWVFPPKNTTYVCDKDSVEVYFETSGQFSPANEFKIYFSGQSGVSMTVKKPGRYKFPASLMQPNGYIDVVVESTSPVVLASAKSIVKSLPPTNVIEKEYTYYSKPETPRYFEPDQVPYLIWGFQKYPYTATYTDGTKTFVFEHRIVDDKPNVFPPKSKVTAYTLKSVSNTCGVTEFDFTTYILWKGYNLSVKYFADNLRFCVGEEMRIPFSVENGTPKNGTRYYLQLSQETQNAPVFQTVANLSSLGTELKYAIPASMTGSYLVRIISDDQIVSETKKIIVNNKPGVTISSGNSTAPKEINYGESVSLTYEFTGGEPYQFTPYGAPEVLVNNSRFSQYYTPTVSSVFQVLAVSNQCGYGTVSGSLSVKVKLQIVSLSPLLSTVCSGSSLPVKYQVAGDIPTGAKIGFYLSRPNGMRIELSSTTSTSGEIALTVPPNLSYGNYKLTCYITGSSIELSSQITIDRAPDIELKGYTTINQGETAYLEIRAKSTGNQMVYLKLSDGSTESMQFSEFTQVYSKKVNPVATTTYTIVSADSQCGAVKYSGTATVIVNPPSERTIRVTGISGRVCEQDTVMVYFSKSGSFSAGNQVTAQLYNSQGQLVKALLTLGTDSPVKAIIPPGLTVTESLRLRLAASDPSTSSSDFANPLVVGKKPSATFAGTQVYQDKSGSAQVIVVLNGNGPWQYRYGNDLISTNKTAYVSPDTLLIANGEPSAYFKLFSVSNSCGAGTLIEPSTVRVEIITALEELFSPLVNVTIAPNPVVNSVSLHFDSAAKREFTLYSAAGIPVWMNKSSEKEPTLNFTQFVPGIYLLKIEENGRIRTFKIIKE